MEENAETAVEEAVPETAAQTGTVPEAAAPAAAPVQMIVAEKDPNVRIIYIDSCIPNNQVRIGPGRYITGSGRIFTVPLSTFEGEFMTPLTINLIDARKFIVLDGLTQEQREQYHCDYREGEVIRQEGTFDFLLKCPVKQAVEAFTALCPEHRAMVAARFIEGYFERNDNRISRDRVEALNEVSRTEGGDGAFVTIVRAINEKV